MLPRRYCDVVRLVTLKNATIEPDLRARLPANGPRTIDGAVGDFLPEPFVSVADNRAQQPAEEDRYPARARRATPCGQFPTAGNRPSRPRLKQEPSSGRSAPPPEVGGLLLDRPTGAPAVPEPLQPARIGHLPLPAIDGAIALRVRCPFAGRPNLGRLRRPLEAHRASERFCSAPGARGTAPGDGRAAVIAQVRPDADGLRAPAAVASKRCEFAAPRRPLATGRSALPRRP